MTDTSETKEILESKNTTEFDNITKNTFTSVERVRVDQSEENIDLTTNNANSEKFIYKYQIAIYFAVTLIIGWFPWYTGGSGVVIAAPTLAALVVTGIVDGKKGIKSVFRRLIIWRQRPTWYLFVLLIPAIVGLVAVSVHVLLGGSAPEFPMFKENQLAILLVLFVFLFPLTSSAFLEEAGFRGYALPKIQEKMGPLKGTLVLGTFFGAWLLPEFFKVGGIQYLMGINFYAWFILTEIAWSVIMTWIFNNTGGSSLMSGWLLHGAFNFWTLLLLTNAVMGDDLVAIDTELLIVNAFVVIFVAILVIIKTKGKLAYNPSN